MVNTTNLNMGVVMNQINPEVIRVSTEYYILLILNNKIKTSDEPERVKQIVMSSLKEIYIILYNNKIYFL